MENLGSKIEKVLLALNKGNGNNQNPPNFTSLRELGRFCHNYVFETNEPIERFTAFFFARYLDNLFINLGGDAKYDEKLSRTKVEIYIHLNGALKKIEEGLKSNNSGVIFKTLSEIVEKYSKEINRLNTS